MVPIKTVIEGQYVSEWVRSKDGIDFSKTAAPATIPRPRPTIASESRSRVAHETLGRTAGATNISSFAVRNQCAPSGCACAARLWLLRRAPHLILHLSPCSTGLHSEICCRGKLQIVEVSAGAPACLRRNRLGLPAAEGHDGRDLQARGHARGGVKHGGLTRRPYQRNRSRLPEWQQH